MAEKTAVRYGGKSSGAFIAGVPDRDLTAAEWDALGKDVQAQCLASGLYEPIGGVKPTAPTVKDGEA